MARTWISSDRRPIRYRLGDDGKTPIPVYEGERTGNIWEDTRRIVAQDRPAGDGEPFVSTVFLVIDHNDEMSGAPVLWETMVFWYGHKLDNYQERYSSYADAVAGHQRVLDMVREALGAPEPDLFGENQ